jgi:hypothetical protein
VVSRSTVVWPFLLLGVSVGNILDYLGFSGRYLRGY